MLDLPTDAQLVVKSFSFAGGLDLTPLMRFKPGVLAKRASISPPEVLNKSLKMVEAHGRSPTKAPAQVQSAAPVR